MNLDIGRSYSFIHEDEEWLSKILIGGVIYLIPILGQLAVLGYTLETARNVSQNKPKPLPTWQDFGDKIMLGLMGFVISLVYSLPFSILVALPFCVIALIGGTTSESGNPEAGGALAALGTLCLTPLIIVASLLLVVAIYAAMVRYVQTGSIGDAFQVGAVWQMVRGNPQLWLMFLLAVLLSGLVASLGTLACGVGALFTTFYAQAALGHTLGQIALQSRPGGGYETIRMDNPYM